jgi:hypothetical protein
LQEREALEEEWRQRVAAVEAAAQKSKKATEAKVAGIIDRLHTLAEQESKREQQRGESLLRNLELKHPVTLSAQ